VWVIGYGRVMGYQDEIPAYQLGKLKILWAIKEYGLYGVWIISELTVHQCSMAEKTFWPKVRPELILVCGSVT
ncbi:hypothetical protein BS17DRAFT_690832, partial [Gyrodon lividus]